MENQSPKLGSLITDGDRRRDAIHIAVTPVTADVRLIPGQDIGFVGDDRERVTNVDDGDAIGIVDPFLEFPVERGDRFWLFLYPNTVTSIRHVWTHPAFTTRPPQETVS